MHIISVLLRGKTKKFEREKGKVVKTTSAADFY
jgi:hypothetical protein